MPPSKGRACSSMTMAAGRRSMSAASLRLPVGEESRQTGSRGGMGKSGLPWAKAFGEKRPKSKRWLLSMMGVEKRFSLADFLKRPGDSSGKYRQVGRCSMAFGRGRVERWLQQRKRRSAVDGGFQ